MSLLGDILVEVINITDKFPEETKREMEMEQISKILTHQEPTYLNRFVGIRKTLEMNRQLVLQAEKGGAIVILDKTGPHIIC
ncbi:unnamed protein product [Protopolystoma xenopodis]|uniref:Uncharacterized protein n=1 Tax=Protopolystoma xenopodis TaxID=117903 RepID=A0A3S5CVH0_9PLAT|nr:unnamed protein product [Protopolystoma xenopodis]